MTGKATVSRLHKTYAGLAPRGRVVASLEALRRGDVDMYHDLGNSAPTDIYKTAVQFEANAVEASNRVSNMLDFSFLNAARVYWRVRNTTAECERDLGEMSDSLREKAEAAEDKWMDEMRAIRRAAHAFADEVGLGVEIVFAAAMVISDQDFTSGLSAGEPSEATFGAYMDLFREAWRKDGPHVLSSAA